MLSARWQRTGVHLELHLNPKVGPTYLKPGQQPVVLTPGKNVKRYIFGALNARTGKVFYGVAEHKIAVVFAQFLDYLSRPHRRRKRQVPATSAIVPVRCSGIASTMPRSRSGGKPSIIAERIAFARMPCASNSRAMLFVRLRTPPFEAA